ncbi:hypothetical protein B0T21DRAFT_406654 [Apiosordaria backusii]|uniref:DUF6546 domain-containing protein n=1 Tax=Apiosordaria backusii TaxID=314023 RepID=A0AA40EYX8_9PEZI|nr:hypothetical protein B0T21DRAFT_406654 [Apiosordaria backusii]
MLEKAGIVALQMPKLDVMELWNGRRGLACVFRYQASGNCAGQKAKITWRSNWHLKLEPRVRQAWEAVAVQRDHREGKFNVVEDPVILYFGKDKIRSHGDAIHHLQLVNEVIRPVSLWQIRYESQFLILDD